MHSFDIGRSVNPSEQLVTSALQASQPEAEITRETGPECGLHKQAAMHQFTKLVLVGMVVALFGGACSSGDPADPASGATCGDGACGTDEDCASCASDCGTCADNCGDTTCGPSESCTSCPFDCGACATKCGDGTCSPGEDCLGCEADCGKCAPGCGDGTCAASESCTSCSPDCGQCPDVCGDGTCGLTENCANCASDCGACAEVCGDTLCSGTETCTSCEKDCGKCAATCGNKTCDSNETCTSCPQDCGACTGTCGDKTCDSNETCSSCAQDCGACTGGSCGDKTCDANETCASCAADCGSCTTGSWTPPIGVPAPPFGIADSHTQYAGKSFNFPSGSKPYPDAGNGPYTHYVDNSKPCKDSNEGGFGSAANPLCTIPTTVPAGSVVEVHGGPYDQHGSAGKPTWTGNGTKAAPVFYRGVGAGGALPIVTNLGFPTISGSYVVVEGFLIDKAGLRTSGDHISIRFSEIRNHPSKNGVSMSGDNVVLYKNEVHHHQGDDRHGVFVGPGSKGVWLVDNYIHHNGGDGIQFCHGCTSNPPDTIYIGRNRIHSDRENSIDIKYAKNVVISENDVGKNKSAPAGQMWCFDDNSKCAVFSSGSDGAAMVIGSDGGPDNPWVIFNKVSDSARGIRIETVPTTASYIIGNSIWAIAGPAVVLEKDADPIYILANTISDVSAGIDQTWQHNFTVHAHNNIFANMKSSGSGNSSGFAMFLESNTVAPKSTAKNNLFWQNGADVKLRWGAKGSVITTKTTAGLAGFAGGANNLIGDPKLTNAASGDMHLQSGSAAIDKGFDLSSLLAAYKTTFGVSLLVDLDNKQRPTGAGWDIGADEMP